MSSKNVATALIDIYVAPKAVFDGLLKVKGWSWLAFGLISLFIVYSQVSFYNGMSVDWLIQQQMLYVADASAAELEMMKESFAKTADYFGIISAIGYWVFVFFTITFMAAYLLLISKFSEMEGKKLHYSDWFAFAVWTQMPLVINLSVFMYLMMSAVNTNLPISLINYASLNQLLLNIQPNQPYFNLTETISIFTVWSAALAAVGLTRWCSMSWVKAVLLAVLPYLLIFGIWALFP